MHWWLVIFLTGHGPIEVKGYFDTLEACKAHGKKEVFRYRDFNAHGNAWFWCYQGGEKDATEK